MKLDQCYKQMDQWTDSHTPFLFIIDFEQQSPLLYSLKDLDQLDTNVLYHFPNVNNDSFISFVDSHKEVSVKPIPTKLEKEDYLERFERAISLMQQQNVEVINLTKPTSLKVDGTLKDIYVKANSKYKVWLKDMFVCCSPEIFVRVTVDGQISTYPMKGTIDANLPNAKELVLNNAKEEREHRATVNVLKEELAVVADKVEITKYRYLDRLTTTEKDLYQVSSEVVGNLKSDFKGKLGTLFKALLPAGSIVGAPKERAFDVIKSVEGYTRGYYTGICGIYDGKVLDSFVLIRFIEKQGDKYLYKSGGGITQNSSSEAEYQEIINKIYVPLD